MRHEIDITDEGDKTFGVRVSVPYVLRFIDASTTSWKAWMKGS
jgi:hypothetical protein